jgi:hypothetical protein
MPSRPPRLLVKTLAMTFIAIAALLVVVFAVVWVMVRNQVRDAVAANLESSQRMFAALETRRQRELAAEAATVAENPTLKAALDTYQSEMRGGGGGAARTDLIETIDRELDKVAARIDSDALLLADMRGTTLAAAGRLAGRWPHGRSLGFAGDRGASVFDGVARAGGDVFRLVAVPLQLDDGSTIGTLYLASLLDQAYVDALARLSGARIAVISDGLAVASTLPARAVRDLEPAIATTRPLAGAATLDGELFAFRRLVSIADTMVYALGSIDDSSRAAQREAIRSLAGIAAFALAIALGGSLWLARLLIDPIDRLLMSLSAMARSHNVTDRLPLPGSSC